jgi:hypothetical protein
VSRRQGVVRGVLPDDLKLLPAGVLPFTYQWVINCTLVTWLPVFAEFHHFIYWGVCGVLILTLLPELRRSKARKLTVGFVICLTVGGLFLTVWPLLPRLRNDERSFYWSLISLFPLVWLAGIDHLACYDNRRREDVAATTN